MSILRHNQKCHYLVVRGSVEANLANVTKGRFQKKISGLFLQEGGGVGSADFPLRKTIASDRLKLLISLVQPSGN